MFYSPFQTVLTTLAELRTSSFGSFLNDANARLQSYATDKSSQNKRGEKERSRPYSEKSKNKFARKAGKPDREKADILSKPKDTKKLEEWHNYVESASSEVAPQQHANFHGLPIVHLGPPADDTVRCSGFTTPPAVDTPPPVPYFPDQFQVNTLLSGVSNRLSQISENSLEIPSKPLTDTKISELEQRLQQRFEHRFQHIEKSKSELKAANTELRIINHELGQHLRFITTELGNTNSELIQRNRDLQERIEDITLQLQVTYSELRTTYTELSELRFKVEEEVMDASRLAPIARSLADQQDKARRVKDAQDIFAIITRNAERSGTRVPPYDFIELIGKGAFGRVYKCRDQKTGNLVAIKIVNIDEQDWSEGLGIGDTEADKNIADFKKEVSILRQLKDNNAKNVNVIHDAFDFHSQLWIVSDYCTGGSIRTLLRPFEKNGKAQGLPEQFIIPIARELAAAIKSMHDLHIIHRDIKCANVYITEDGNIQLGDFGIVGVIDHDNTKRKTVVGTPHWMPREIIESLGDKFTTEGYGSEIDIWSYGCTVYEMATGAPPYSRTHIDMLPTRLEEAPPRLEGDQYSEELKDLIAFCLNPDKQERPTADDVMEHPYIKDTSHRFPARALVRLIEKFKIWEHGGGSRASLWMDGPTDVRNNRSEDGPESDESEDDVEGWNFSTSDSFDQEFGRRISQLPPGALDDWQWDVPHATGLPPLQTQNISIAERIKREHSELSANRGEQSLARLYDPSDPSGYQLKTPVTQPVSDQSTTPSDLPLRDFTDNAPTRESMIEIDLDEAGVGETATSTFAMHMNQMNAINEDTVRPLGHGNPNDDDDDNYYGYGQFDDKRATMEWSFASATPAIKRETMQWTFPAAASAAASDVSVEVATSKPKRGTMDWTFGTAESASPDKSSMSRSASFSDDLAPGFRPQLKHTVTEPIGQFGDFQHTTGLAFNPPNRESVRSLIDLDAGIAERVRAGNEILRPDTASSQLTDATSGNPFDLEDDLEQREVDRNRFSYHKQYRSEGGEMVKRLSHKTMQMHARGNSLSSTESELGPASQPMQPGFPSLAPPMGFDALDQDLGLATPIDSDSNQWPSFENTFDSFDSSPQYLPAPTDDMRLPRLGDFAPRANGLSVPASSRDPSNEPRGPKIDFPLIQPPHPEALTENVEDSLLEGELGRMLDDCAFSLAAVQKALMQHAGVEEDEEVGGADVDSGFDSTNEATDLTARRKPRKSPRLPVAESFPQ